MFSKLKVIFYRLLKKSEKFTKTDMIYLIKGGSWLGLGQIVSMSVTLLTSVVFANLLDPELYGNYKYILSITALLSLSTLSGMDSAITQSVARGFDGTLDLGVKTKIKWGFLGSIASLFISIYYFAHENTTLAIGFSITAFFIPFVESLDMYNSLLWGKKLFNIQTKYDIIKKVITFTSIVGIIYLTKNIHIILLTYFLSLMLPTIFFYYKTHRTYKSNNDIDKDDIKYGKNLSAVYIINTILNELDKVLIFQHVGASDLANYTLALAPTDQIKGLMKNINSLAMPQFTKRTFSDIKKNIWNKLLVLFVTTCLMVTIYIFIAPIFFKIFFPKYLSSIILSRILALSLIPVVLSSFLYTILESKKAQKQIYQFNMCGGIFGIITLFPLVYFYGIWGAIISRFINRTLMLMVGIILIRKID